MQYRDLSTTELKEKMKEIGIKFQFAKKSNQQHTTILNKALLQKHPINDYLRSLAKDKLSILSKVFKAFIEGNRVLYIADKICSIYPDGPIKAVVDILNDSDRGSDPLPTSTFEALKLLNPPYKNLCLELIVCLLLMT